MKSLFHFCLILALTVSSSKSQLFQHEVNCETFADPLNYNAYYERCIGKIVVHKFCPDKLVWNQSKNSCCENQDENSGGCQNVVSPNEYGDVEQSFNSNEIVPNRRPTYRPPPPVIVRPPNNASLGVKVNTALSSLLVLIVMFL